MPEMKKSRLFLSLAAAAAMSASAATHYVGGDISLLPEYQQAGAKYYDHGGRRITSFLPWCREQGMNAMRVRLFVDPSAYQEQYPSKYDPNACQDLDYILPLCSEIAEADLDLMLDFHYSDTWADPAAQWTPAAWANLNDDELCHTIYDYTRECLIRLREAGITPAFIQPGNEISYGMLWGPVGTTSPKKTFMGSNANWERLGRLLNSAIEACREICPESKIIIHTERVAQPNVLANFYNQMARLGVDYDIIGLSYYPYWHGDMSVLDTALTTLEAQFPEHQIMLVETGYGLKWQVPGADHDTTDIWPISDAGQAAFARDLVDTLEAHASVNGLFWWWMEYNPYGTSLSGWYNAPLFDPTNGRASSAFKVICSFADGSGIEGIGADKSPSTESWYDLTGRPVSPDAPGMVISTTGAKRIN